MECNCKNTLMNWTEVENSPLSFKIKTFQPKREIYNVLKCNRNCLLNKSLWNSLLMCIFKFPMHLYNCIQSTLAKQKNILNFAEYCIYLIYLFELFIWSIIWTIYLITKIITRGICVHWRNLFVCFLFLILSWFSWFFEYRHKSKISY